MDAAAGVLGKFHGGAAAGRGRRGRGERRPAGVGAAFGVAVLAAVFASRGGYRTPAEFVHGFRPAMVVAGLVPFGGILAGLFARGRQPVGEPGRTLGDPAAVAEPAYLEQTL